MPCPIHCSVPDKKWVGPKPFFYIWSKAKICRPRDYFKSEKCYRKRPFVSVADCCKCGPPNMYFLLGNEYGRQHVSELQQFKQRICCAQEKHRQQIRKVMKNPPPAPVPCVQPPQRFIMKK